jgi:hypothetical protein
MYCWRCDMEIPMLEEHEWAQVAPLLRESISDIQAFRKRNDASLSDALNAPVPYRALELYERLTGFRETNINALWHHRASGYGPPCAHCGKPLRTPKAKLCAACGKSRSGEPIEP